MTDPTLNLPAPAAELIPAADGLPAALPVSLGEALSCQVTYSCEDIARFARESGDTNPLHQDPEAARRSRHGRIIASGQQTAARMMGLVASHFSRRQAGLAREVLCLNFNFAFRAPVFAEQALTLHWTVEQLSLNRKLGGWLAELAGQASRTDDGTPCVIGRGTVLVKGHTEPDPRPDDLQECQAHVAQ